MGMIATPLGTFQFEPYKMEGEWIDEAGVYLFVRTTPGGESEVLYVGLCDSFKNRMCAHERWEEAVREGANSVHAAFVSDPALRQALERHLIAEYQPPLNVS